jgi:hypothetical protein
MKGHVLRCTGEAQLERARQAVFVALAVRMTAVRPYAEAKHGRLSEARTRIALRELADKTKEQ